MSKMKAETLLHVVCLVAATAKADNHDQDSWQPLVPAAYYHTHHPKPDYGEVGVGLLDSGYQQQQEAGLAETNDQCAIYKVGFSQDLYFQYIQYKTDIPDLKQFTLCYWAKFHNHSNDHPIFSYAVDGQPKAIVSVITNTERSSYFSLGVDGHTFYRLNYPLRLNKWYHTCQSWNGRTGEWQIWVNAERVGRGFHNRLVGHVISSGGIAITGQVQSQLGGGFQEGFDAPKGSGGMLGEITMVQLYNVALTAGKAHKDHKHHHAHQYDHNGNVITTPPPSTTIRPQVTHPLLTAGQLNRGTRINFATGQQPQIIQGQEYSVGYANGQLVGGLVTQQLTKQRIPQNTLPQAAGSIGSQSFNSIGYGGGSLGNPANVQFINTYPQHSLFKRQNNEEIAEPKFGDKVLNKREAVKQKRELFVAGGTLYDDGLEDGPPAGTSTYQNSLLYGLAGLGDNQPILKKQKQSDEREPAEAEVKAVMNVCSGCDSEPFDKALVFGWRTVPKKLFSGTFYTPAVPQCRVF